MWTEAHNSRTSSLLDNQLYKKRETPFNSFEYSTYYYVSDWFRENKNNTIFNNELRRNSKWSKMNYHTGANGTLSKHELQTRGIIV